MFIYISFNFIINILLNKDEIDRDQKLMVRTS